MNLQLTRKTGFYGMGSPFVLLVNGKKYGAIRQGQTKTIQLADTEAQGVIIVKFSILQSTPYYYDVKKTADQELEVVFNPSFVLLYIGLFLLLVVAAAGLVFLVIGLIAYFVFLVMMSRRALVIRPISKEVY